MDNSFATKTVFTTGEVARICNISQQTVIRLFDKGRLQGFRVPGSRFRRIPRQQLIAFMKDNGISLKRLGLTERRILVVDDDEEIANMLKELMTREGIYEVRVGSTGFEAGMLARDFLPNVILLDFKLPDINGNVVCRAVREQDGLRETQIIIMSGVVDPAEVDELMRAGANAFIKKPFDVSEVLKKIEELIGD